MIERLTEPKILIMISALVILIVLFCKVTFKKNKLDNIKAKEVGDGQHGTDTFMTEEMAIETFAVYKLPTKMEDRSKEFKRGRIVHFNEDTREVYIDVSDTHADVEAPTEVGKTTRQAIPNIQYNLMAGTNMIIPCIKREIIDLTRADAMKLNYNTFVIDFENPASSCGFDFFKDINEAIKKYDEEGDLKDKAYAETAAEKLADDIVTSKMNEKTNVNQFFTEASKGLIQSAILLVSMFAEEEEKHFSSVRSLIQNVLTKTSIVTVPGQAKEPKIASLLKGMPDDFGPKKHIGAALAASSETEDNIYSSCLGDLRPMNNSNAEQIISVPKKEKMFHYTELLKPKTILYIHCPDSMPEYYLFFKLIIKKIFTQLANASKKYEKERLPYDIYVPWDEFGVSPPIQSIDNELSMDRSKGIYLDLIYQDKSQLIKNYGEDISNIIRNQCGVSIFLGVAATNHGRAEEISKMCGVKTILSGTVSTSRNQREVFNENRSYTEQMMERPLLTPGEILRFESTKNHLIFKRGKPVFKARYTPYYQKEWGIEPLKIKVPEEDHNYHNIKYMNYEMLEKKMDAYRSKLGVVVEKRESTMTYKKISNDMDTVCDSLYEMTNGDKKPVELLRAEKIMELMAYMKENHREVSNYDLRQLISKLV